jgi:hypothetical protein
MTYDFSVICAEKAVQGATPNFYNFGHIIYICHNFDTDGRNRNT